MDPPCTITLTWVMQGNYGNSRCGYGVQVNCVCVSSVGLFRHSSYVRFDILQRILSRLFGITVVHAMVITDIDDKIIRRSWEVRPSCACWLLLCSHLLTSCVSCGPTGKRFPSRHQRRVRGRVQEGHAVTEGVSLDLHGAADQHAL